MVGGDGGIVQETEAAGHVGVGMMSRRAAQCVCRPAIFQHYAKRRQRTVCGCLYSFPCSVTDRARRVCLEEPGLPDDVFRHAGHVAARMNIRDDFRTQVRQRLPPTPRTFQERQVVGAMNRRNGPKAECLRFTQLMTCILDSLQEPLCPFRTFRTVGNPSLGNE